MILTNLDWIKSLDLEQMTNFLTDNSACDWCICNLTDSTCSAVGGCEEGIRRWLEAPVDLDCDECPLFYE